MSGERFVVLGLATARAEWFGTLSQWATAGSVPVEFIKCVSAEQLLAHLRSSRQYSAAVLDGSLIHLDRDMVQEVSGAGCPVIVVDHPDRGDRWLRLGAVAVLGRKLDRDELVHALGAHCAPLAPPGAAQHEGGTSNLPPPGSLIAVCGPGGTGVSSVAIALSQALARRGQNVVLADLARRAQQALLHDSEDLGPGLPELVESCRSGDPTPEGVSALTFFVPERGYHLLLGLRRSSGWTALRPRALERALLALRCAFEVVVADIDGDVEGQRESGSVDVEERNSMSRLSAANADVIVAVGQPGLKGLHSLVWLVYDLLSFGVDAGRIVVVFNCAPKSPRARSEISEAFGSLAYQVAKATPSRVGQLGTAGPLFLPSKPLERVLRDRSPLPDALGRPVASAALAILERQGRSAKREWLPERVVPGTLGSLPDDAASAGDDMAASG